MNYTTNNLPPTRHYAVAARKAKSSPETFAETQHDVPSWTIGREELPKASTIEPQDPGRPCYFARLPAELRLQIYDRILPSKIEIYESSFTKQPESMPVGLHVCRLIRREVAALFYGSVHIMYKSRYPKYPYFELLEQWISTVSKEHRVHLIKNKNLTVFIRARVLLLRNS